MRRIVHLGVIEFPSSNERVGRRSKKKMGRRLRTSALSPSPGHILRIVNYGYSCVGFSTCIFSDEYMKLMRWEHQECSV